MSRASDTIVVSGSVAQRPGYGGHAWVFLQYLLGLRRLGWDVLFLDRLERAMAVDETGPRYLETLFRDYDLGDSYALFGESGETVAGLDRGAVVKRVRDSALLLNVMGFLGDEEILAASRLRVFLDIDPGFGQMWQQLGLADQFAGHDAYVTLAANIGREDCAIPTCGLDWITTAQPVVLEHWPAEEAVGRAFTTVASWRGPYDPVVYEGKTYRLRAHEFRRFVALPELTNESFELALEIHPAETQDLSRLVASGWSLVDPEQVAGNASSYRAYVQASKAEFMVAKNMYVDTRSGWFSDRSTCYLASGRPVLAQDTGVGDLYGSGAGLLLFATLDEAVAGVEEISRNYQRHAQAARALAEEVFDSDKVLSRLLRELDV
jgi:hypothetical protein